MCSCSIKPPPEPAGVAALTDGWTQSCVPVGGTASLGSKGSFVISRCLHLLPPCRGCAESSIARRMHICNLPFFSYASCAAVQPTCWVRHLCIRAQPSFWLRQQNLCRVEHLHVQALLSFRRDEFTFPFVVKSLVQAIDDPKERVKLAAVEAMAVVSSMVGSQTGPLLSAVGAPESARSLLNERFANKALPSLNADDLVEHQVGCTNRLSTLPLTAPKSARTPLHGRFAGRTLCSLNGTEIWWSTMWLAPAGDACC